MVACVASVSARVRRERRDESSNFRAITRLETLATQAKYMENLKQAFGEI